MNYDLTLSAILKRIAYDASEQAIGDQVEATHRQDVLEEEYSEQLVNDLLEHYQDALSSKQALYDKDRTRSTTYFGSAEELWDDIQQIKSIITILKTNTL